MLPKPYGLIYRLSNPLSSNPDLHLWEFWNVCGNLILNFRWGKASRENLSAHNIFVCVKFPISTRSVQVLSIVTVTEDGKQIDSSRSTAKF